jgi:hypothetical protein
MKSLALFALLSLLIASKYTACGTENASHKKDTLTSYTPCIPALWNRTYGPMDRFSLNTDRTTLPHRCVLDVKATLTRAPLDMSDGDVKIWFTMESSNYNPVVPQPYPYDRYKSLYKSEFFPPGSDATMAAEVVCAAVKHKIVASGKFYDGWWSPVKDLKNENGLRACYNYTDTIYAPFREKNLKKGDVIYITGELVKDTGPCASDDGPCHGHIEIHPVSIIKD